MKKITIILLAAVLIGITSCEKWLDINKNPNTATSATPDLILPGVLTNWCSDVDGLTATFGAWMGYWAHAGGWSGWTSEKKYEITSSYAAGYFNGYYPGVLTDTKFIRDNSGTNVIYPSITSVVDAWYYSRLVDMYGDVPYTEANNPKNLTPKYDKGADIYADLIKRLDAAMAAFDAAVNAPDHATNPIYAFTATSDIVYGGNFTSWKVFANTLKLRLVMRMSNISPVATLKALMDNTLSYGFITADVTGSPGYLASSGKTNPLWNSYGKTYDNIKVDPNTEYILNAYFHQKLLAMADPRLTNLFFPGASAGGVLKSFVLGTDGDLVAQPNSTIEGNYSWILICANAALGSNGTAATVTGALDKQVLFMLSEAQFLQAEAQMRGVIVGATTAGATETASYTAAVTSALTRARVTAANQATYLALATVAWDPAATAAAKLEKLIDQKWISNYFLNHFESWNDYRRTGFPRPKGGSVSPLYEMLSYYPGGTIRRQVPRLFPYPNEEFTLNKANVQAAVTAQGVDFTTSVYPFDARTFWDNAPKVITY